MSALNGQLSDPRTRVQPSARRNAAPGQACTARGADLERCPSTSPPARKSPVNPRCSHLPGRKRGSARSAGALDALCRGGVHLEPAEANELPASQTVSEFAFRHASERSVDPGSPRLTSPVRRVEFRIAENLPSRPVADFLLLGYSPLPWVALDAYHNRDQRQRHDQDDRRGASPPC